MGLLIILIVLLVLAGLGFLIYYFTQKKEGESVAEMVDRISKQGYDYVTKTS
jgi:uncharacterized membrane protein